MKRLVRYRRAATIVGPAVLLLIAKACKAPHPYYAWGLGIMVVGQALRIWAAGYLRKKGCLTTSGPFSYTRNPLYFGSSLIGAGQCIMSGLVVALPVFVFLFWVFYYPAILEEERRLSKAFDTEYMEFQQRVPRWLPHWGLPYRAPEADPGGAAFSFRQAMRNREYEAVLINTFVALAMAVRV